jgi:hypothetical protein
LFPRGGKNSRLFVRSQERVFWEKKNVKQHLDLVTVVVVNVGDENTGFAVNLEEETLPDVYDGVTGDGGGDIVDRPVTIGVDTFPRGTGRHRRV